MNQKYASIQKESVESQKVQQIRRVLSRDGKRRVFGYAKLDDGYGACNEYDEKNQAAFERGGGSGGF